MANRSLKKSIHSRRRSETGATEPSPFPLLAMALVIAAMLLLRNPPEPMSLSPVAPALAALQDLFR